MDGRLKLSFSSKQFSLSTFVCFYFLLLGHNNFSLSIRIDNETIRPANKIINISRDLCQVSSGRLLFTILQNPNERQKNCGPTTYVRSSSNKKHFLHFRKSKTRTKRTLKDKSNTDISTSLMSLRNERSMLSRQQKLGPIFYQEPPSTFYFSNDTGKFFNTIFIQQTQQ